MQIMIDIPDDKYHTILNHAEEILDVSSFIEPRYLYLAVIKGTPLPKGHGRLIDADKLSESVLCKTFGLRSIDIKNALTIIEADKEE